MATSVYTNAYFAIDYKAEPKDTDYILFSDEKVYAFDKVPEDAFIPRQFYMPGDNRIVLIGGYWPTDGTDPCFGEEAVRRAIKDLKDLGM